MPDNTYSRIIERIFFRHYKKNKSSFQFSRDEIQKSADALGVKPPKNLGDVVYSFRYRRPLPSKIQQTCREDEEWIIRGIGPAIYEFKKVPVLKIEPRKGLYRIKVPDATPEIVARYALSDEQALLAKVRYNRLIDIFTGITTYSLQNHLRTQLDGVQMEIDELYVGVGKSGAQYILPVEAKGGRERIGRIQLEQDAAFCRSRFPELICRLIAAQFMPDDEIAMFELTLVEAEIQIVEERHYKLVPSSEIGPEDLEIMRRTAAEAAQQR